MNNLPNGQIVPIGKAAEILGVSIDTLRRWDRSGKLKSVRPDGKNRFFSVSELEKTKADKPLSISEASKKLGVSSSTLRRYEQRGIIKPNRNDQGERVYDEHLIQNLSLTPAHLEKPEPKKEPKKTPFFGRAWQYPPAFILIILLITTIFSTLYIQDRYRANKERISISAARVLGARDQGGIVGFFTRIGERISENNKKSLDQYKTAFKFVQNTIAERTIVESITRKGELAINEKTLGDIKDKLLQGREPGTTEGDIAFFAPGGGITGLKVGSANLLTGSVSGGIGGIILDSSITASDLADGAVTSSKIANDTIKNEDILGSAINSEKIEDNTVSASDLAATLSFGNGDLIDLSAITHSSTSKMGLILPNVSSATPSSPSGGEGYIAWNAVGDQIVVFNGSSWTAVSGGGGSGTITGVTAGNGLTGGGVSGTVSLAVGLTASGTTGSTSSNSGFEVSSSGITLLKGCTDGELLKWTDAGGWACAADIGGAGGGISTIEENDVSVVTSATSIDFLGSDFIVGAVGAEGNISIDYANSKIVRSDQTQSITGAWSFSLAIAANGGITFDAATDTVGAHTLSGTIDANTNIITNIGATTTDFTTSGSLAIGLDAADTNGALMVDNVAQANPIIVAKDNGTMVWQVGDGGLVTMDPATTGTVENIALATQWTTGTVISAAFATATTQTGAEVGLSFDLSTNNTVPNSALGNQTGLSLTLKDGGASATSTAISLAGTYDTAILIGGTVGANILDSASIDITAAGVITGATGVSTTTMTASGAIAANGGITFDSAADTVGAHTLSGTVDAANNIITNIGNAGTDFIASTGALTLAGVLTANGGVSIADGQNLTAYGNTTLGNAATDQVTVVGEVLGATPLSFEGATDNNIYTIFAITDPTTSSKTITFPNATITVNAAADLSGNTLASGITASSLTSVGTLTSLTVSGATAANGGITFDAATDTVGAHTLSGTVDAANNIITNIGNAGTDFVASTGALNLAGLLTASSGVSVAASQSYTGAGAVTLSSGGALGLTLDSASGKVSIATGDNLGIGTSNALDALEIDVSNTTSTVLNSVRFVRTDSDSVGATGLGTGLDFYLEDSNSNVQQAGRLDLVWESATDTTEDSYFIFNDVIDSVLTDSVIVSHKNVSMNQGGAAMFNSYNRGSGDKYWNTESAFEIWHDTGTDRLSFQGAASGTGGTVVTFSELLSLSTAGNAILTGTLAVNGDSITSDGALTIDGNARVSIATGDFLSTSVAGITGAAAGDIWYDSTALKYKINENGTTKTLCNLTDAGCGAGGSTRWDQIVDPTAVGAVAMADWAQTLDFVTASTAIAMDGLTVSITNASATDVTTQRGFVVANLNDAAATGTVESIAVIENRDINETVTNGLLVDNTAAGTLTNGIQVTDSAGTVGTGILIADGAGTMTTGLALTGTFTTGIDMGNSTLEHIGNAATSFNSTGGLTLASDLTANAQSDVRFADADSTNWVAFQAPATVVANVTWTLPSADAAGCFKSDGAGTVSIATCGDVKTETITSTGEWSKPSGAILVIVEVWGGGGGGGAGASRGTVIFGAGGGAGGGGAYNTASFSASSLGTVFATVGAGGGGGAGAANTTGGVGTAGGQTCFSTATACGGTMYLQAFGGGGGASAAVGNAGGGGGGAHSVGASSTTTTGGTGGGPLGATAGLVNSGSGGGGGTTAIAAPVARGHGNFGGGGGSASSIDGSANSGIGAGSIKGGGGGGGGASAPITTFVQRSGGAGGPAGSILTTGAAGGSTAGQAGTAGAAGIGFGGGGGGGGASLGTGGTGGAGGAGGSQGGGGGGGGASTFSSGTQTGGAGGVGGLGEVRITTIKGTGADLAEIYSSNDPTLETGDVVSIDSSLKAGVKKSDKSYDSSSIGIVSTQPGLTIGDSDGEGVKPVLVALAGRVPVKVSIENGSIASGDLLTPSSVPGVAMKATKAGIVIGQALTKYEGEGPGYVVAFIKNSYANGSKLADVLSGFAFSGLEATIEQKALVYFASKQEQLAQATDLSEVFTDRVSAGLEVITPKLFADEIFANKIHAKQIEGLTFLANQIISEKFIQAQNVLDAQTATESATLSDIDTNLTIDSLIANKGLTVFGLAKFMDGVTFNGPVSYLGDVFFERTPTFNSDTAGFALIKEGFSEVRVDFAEEYAETPVVSASPIWDADKPTVDTIKQLGAYVLPKQEYIIASVDRKGFLIVLEDPAVTDLKFSWFAIAVRGVRTVNSISPEPTVILTPIPEVTATPIPTSTPTFKATPTPTLEETISPSPVPSQF